MATRDFYSALGSVMTTWRVNGKSCTLTRVADLELPAPVQYAWRHPALPLLYVAISDRFSSGGDRHGLAVLRIDSQSGCLSQAAPIHWLANRPVHLTVDRAGSRLAVAYNEPSELSVHRLDGEGLLKLGEAAIVSPVGTYAHQVRFTPDDRHLIVSARGNDATPETDEEPGSLEVFALTEDGVEYVGAIAPSGGFGFGPRHVDFHPNGKWMYVSVERQNELHVFEIDAGSISAAPVFVTSTLAVPDTLTMPQLAGAIHVSADGRFVYLSNRAHGTTSTGQSTSPSVFAGGENSIAAFAIDATTGKLTLIQHAEVHGFHPRSFALHPDAGMLVAATVFPLAVFDRKLGQIQQVEAALSVFSVASDGKLTRAQTIEIDTAGQWLFWCGMIERPV